MPDSEKRKEPRISVCLPVNYICTDGDGTELSTGMGKTINISTGGLFLESPIQIESDYIVLMTIDLKNELMTVNGKVAHSRVGENGLYETGIEFTGTPQENVSYIKILVETYHAKKKK